MVDGYQTISMALRAPRVVIVFDGDGDWHTWASMALHAAGRIWGGAGFVLIPHHEGAVKPAMLDLAAGYDPDYVVAYMRSVGEVEAASPGTFQFRSADGEDLTGEKRAEALAFNADQRIGEQAGLRARDAVAEVCNPYRMFVDSHGYHERTRSLGHQDVASPLTEVATLGGGTPIGMGVPAGLGLSPAWELAVAMRIGCAEMRNLTFESGESLTDDQVREHISFALQPGRRDAPEAVRIGPGTSSAWDRTTVGLVRVSPATGRRVPHLVVAGSGPEDFCLAYGWDRMYGRGVWLPLVEMPAEGSLEHVPVWSLGMEVRGLVEYQQEEVRLTSASLGSEELVALRQGLIGDAPYVVVRGVDDDDETERERAARLTEHAIVVEPGDLEWPPGGDYAVADSYDHSFTLPASVESDGTVRLLTDLPLLEPPGVELTNLRDWETDVRLAGRTFAFGRPLDPAVLLDLDDNPWRETWLRSGRDALSLSSFSYGLVLAGSTRRQSMAHARLVMPGLRSWIDGMLLHEDVRAAYSDAGRRVEVLRRLWGSRAELIADWAGPGRAVFQAFKPTARRSTDAYPNGEGENLRDAGYLTFDGMAAFAGAESVEARRQLRDWTDGLLERQVLRRGLILQCDDCDWRDFTPLGSLGDRNACQRCGAVNVLRQQQWSRKRVESEPSWYYDLHQAARQIFADDGGVALLAADHLSRQSRQFDVTAELDFFTTPSNEQLAEVDLVAISDGRLIVGEAKKTPGLGGRRERAKKVSALCIVAGLMHADEVLLCSAGPGPWPQADIDALRAAVQARFADRRRRPSVRVLTGLTAAQIEDTRVR